MDPTQPVQTNSQPNITPNPVQPIQPVQPNITPPLIVSPTPQKSSPNKILLTLTIILTIIVIVGGYIIFSIIQEKTPPKITPQISPTESVKVTATITPTPITIETDDPNNIDVGETETDLKSIEGDIESLQ